MKLNTAVWLFMTRERREEKKIYSRFPLFPRSLYSPIGIQKKNYWIKWQHTKRGKHVVAFETPC